MQPKLIATFDHLSEVDFLAKAGAVTTSILDPPIFPSLSNLRSFSKEAER